MADNTSSSPVVQVVEVQRLDETHAVTLERVTAGGHTWHELHVESQTRRGDPTGGALAPAAARSFAAMIRTMADRADQLNRHDEHPPTDAHDHDTTDPTRTDYSATVRWLAVGAHDHEAAGGET